jgi:hypothetical protein
MGWEDADWTFTCIDWTPMIEDLIAPHGRCTMAAAGARAAGALLSTSRLAGIEQLLRRRCSKQGDAAPRGVRSIEDIAVNKHNR